MKRHWITVFVSSIALLGSAWAEEEKSGYYYEDPLIKMQLIPRTPDQMAAFYEARGFTPEAIQLVRATCFITVGIGNVGKDVVWLDLKNWRFKSHNVPITRYDRNYWKSQWQQLNLPAAKQATFSWTLLPETRDLLPNEPVGGNIIFPVIDEPFSLEAHFRLGADKRGDDLAVIINNIKCAKDPLPPAEPASMDAMPTENGGTPPTVAPAAPTPPNSEPNNVIRR